MYTAIRLFGGAVPYVLMLFAGGWTDTPPYSLFAGGNVVNLAIELNGQPPLQVYVKPCKEYRVVLRSIDMGAMEVVNTFEELQDYCTDRSAFSIPEEAALTLAGFGPAFSGSGLSFVGETVAGIRHRYRDYFIVCYSCRLGLGNQFYISFYGFRLFERFLVA